MSSSPKAAIDWDQFFFGIAQLAALRSKDPLTKNGACIVSPDHKILGVGYNGLPRGCDDSDPTYWSDDDSDPFRSRHSYVVHAEINAILNCVVLRLAGSAIYVTQFPCPKCAQAIIQTGIGKVIYHRRKEHHGPQIRAVEKMFQDAGVVAERISDINPATGEWIENLEGYLTKGKGG